MNANGALPGSTSAYAPSARPSTSTNTKASRAKRSGKVARALAAIGSYFDGDRTYLFQFDGTQRRMDNTHEWCVRDVEPHRERLVGRAVADFPSVARLLRSGESILIANVLELPNGPEREEFELEGIRSLLLVPMT